jgi:L-alanine-DL-glutamate epimerase-like enolase superfamily enzyme
MNFENEEIRALKVSAYQIPTDYPESDGTLKWNSTTLILTEIEAANQKGIGYTYADASVVSFIERNLKELVLRRNALDIPAIWQSLYAAIRNNGTSGLACMAIAAVDNALWDLKAKILGVSLSQLLGKAKDQIEIYGSGGFTSYPADRLQHQLSSWVESGIKKVKIKIGRDAAADPKRIKESRAAIGNDNQLFIDANGAYDEKTALEKAIVFNDYGISWFEEPVSADNLKGLKFIREHAPANMKIAAGEYGDTLGYFSTMLSAGAVDVLQADATRCCGITGYLKAGILAQAYKIPFSFHCAPAIHLHASMSLGNFFIGEYFHDHVRIENMLFDGVQTPVNGFLKPDESRVGHGLVFKQQDAEKYRII